MFAVYSFVFLIFLINTHSILCTTKTQHTKLINTFSGGATNEDDMGFKVLSSSLMYKGWRSIIRKKCLFPNKKVVDFDVVSQGCTSIIVVAWDTKTRTCTLIREYHPGPECLMYGFPAGMYEPDKHSSSLEGAKFELEEEAQLRSDKWIPLLDDISMQTPCDKYTDNAFHPYLALDCIKVENPRAMDDEEYIQVTHGVTYKEVMKLVKTGKLNVNSSYAMLMAMRKLEELGIPLE